MEKADLYWLARLFLKIELFDKTRTLKPLKLDLSVFKFIDILIKTIKKKGILRTTKNVQNDRDILPNLGLALISNIYEYWYIHRSCSPPWSMWLSSLMGKGDF